jgi:lysophospholipase L1-like esterase
VGLLRRNSHLFGAACIVAAIVAGASLPVVMNAGAAPSLAVSRTPVAACSPPAMSGSAVPVADASPPCTPTMEAKPHTDLLDSQTIAVSGSGFPPDDFLPLIECQTGATDAEDCQSELEGFAQTDQTGAFSTSLTVTRQIPTGTTTVDCARRGACVVAAVNEANDMVEATTPVTFKDVPLPTLSVSPATDLSDGQNVTVNGDHFDPNSQVTFTECPAGQVQVYFACDSDILDQVTAGPTGAFTATYQVARILTTNEGPDGGSVDCAQPPGCILAALGNFDDDLTASTPLAFNPSVPPLPPLDLNLKLKPAGHVAADGGAVLSATISCTTKTPVEVSIGVTLTEDADSELASSSIATEQTCVKTPSPVSFTVPEQDVPFVAGVGEATLNVSARNGSALTQEMVSGAVTLTVPAHQPPPVYYVALGDSLAAGFASPSGQGYANDLLTYLQAKVPNLQLADLGCSSETTTTMIEGGICSYPAGSQLAAATGFLAAHRGSVDLVTVDIGGNDYLGCLDANPPSYNAQCIEATDKSVTTNLTTIMSQIRAAAGAAVPIVGMNYFDPFLDYWPDGSTGRAIAKTSVQVLGNVNATISAVFTGASSPVADVAGAFETTDLKHKVKSPWGRVPVAVVNTCTWLDFTCAKGQGGFGDDTNAAGSSVIAGAFEKVVPAGLASREPVPH